MATDLTELLIESVFMNRLVEIGLYGEPAEGLLDSLKERAPNGLTENILRSAAESIIRKHRAKSFPSFPICNQAIRDAMEGKITVGRELVLASEPVTAENFSARAKDFGFRQEPKHGKWPVAYRFRLKDDMSFVWAMDDGWEAYFEFIGDHGRAGMIRSGHKVTVPTKDPRDFDLRFAWAPKPETDKSAPRASWKTMSRAAPEMSDEAFYEAQQAIIEEARTQGVEL